MVELREPKLRPKAPDGCLNWGTKGHSHRSCSKPFSGRFCQTCSNPDFSTEDCPWPHYKELPSKPSPFASEIANVTLWENIAQTCRLVVEKDDTDSEDNAE